jgi:hypothetical protein
MPGDFSWALKIPELIADLPTANQYIGDNPLMVGEEGVNIPAGTLLTSTLQIQCGVSGGIDLSAIGITKFAVDKITYTSDTYSVAIPHSLGEKPKFALLLGSKKVNATYSANSNNINIYQAVMVSTDSSQRAAWAIAGLNSSGADSLFTYGWSTGEYVDSTSESVQIYHSKGSPLYRAYLAAGVEYTLITLA